MAAIKTLPPPGPSPLTLKHTVGFELSASPCNMSFPATSPNGTWWDAPIILGGAETVRVRSQSVDKPMCVRYNWYNAACMPSVGPELCAIYGTGFNGELFPAPLFIMDIDS